jgi:hypothetical protein
MPKTIKPELVTLLDVPELQAYPRGRRIALREAARELHLNIADALQTPATIADALTLRHHEIDAGPAADRERATRAAEDAATLLRLGAMGETLPMKLVMVFWAEASWI